MKYYKASIVYAYPDCYPRWLSGILKYPDDTAGTIMTTEFIDLKENMTVENELRQSNDAIDGYFVWSVRENGNYGLQWKGADS